MSETYISKVPYDDGVVLKTRLDLRKLAESGRCVARTLAVVAAEVKPGVPASYLEELCNSFLEKEYAESILEMPEDFPHYISVSVNEVAVHGVPTSLRLRGGDIVTLDVALRLDGWFGDSAVTVPVGTVAPARMRLIEHERGATEAGIAAVKAGGRLGDIGAAVSRKAESCGCRIIENLAGHGVGQELHEAPTVLHSGERSVGPPIVPGMVFTVEPVLTTGDPIVVPEGDGPAFRTRDGSITALFEHTIAVTSEGVWKLTELPRQ